MLKEILSPKFELIMLNTVMSCLSEEGLYLDGLRVIRDYARLSLNVFKSEEKVS